jgi:TetR/AcrR family transcriptional repressor of nem operon
MLHEDTLPLSTQPKTSGRILAVAERLAQTRGFNGFSYADIAADLAITKASLHYHFATKAELGRALIARYAERFAEGLAEIDKAADVETRIRRYMKLYESVLVRDRMCLCGMFAAEYETLPAAMQQELRHFFNINEIWLIRNLESGRKAGRLRFEGSATGTVRLLIAALEGAMLLARAYGEPARFTATAKRLLAELRASRSSRGPAKRPAKSAPKNRRP